MGLFFQIIIAAFLLILINYLGRVTKRVFGYVNIAEVARTNQLGYNLFLRVLAPSVFITFVVIVLHATNNSWLVSDIWHSIVLYSVMFTTILFITRRIWLINPVLFLIVQFSTIGLGYLFQVIFWDKGLEYILPDNSNFRTELWVLLLIFFYSVLNTYRPDYQDGESRKFNFFAKRYKFFLDKYSSSISADLKSKPDLHRLLFAIMITEDFNRGPIARIIERGFWFTGLIKTSGIMQMESTHSLSDEESVVGAQEKLVTASRNVPMESGWDRIRQIAFKYNPDDQYSQGILETYGVLENIESIWGIRNETHDV